MNMNCRHCGNMTRIEPTEHDRVVWCAQCIKEELDLLVSLELDNITKAVLLGYIASSNSIAFGIRDNIVKLRAIPPKNRRSNVAVAAAHQAAIPSETAPAPAVGATEQPFDFNKYYGIRSQSK
jgi:hypothetical protein